MGTSPSWWRSSTAASCVTSRARVGCDAPRRWTRSLSPRNRCSPSSTAPRSRAAAWRSSAASPALAAATHGRSPCPASCASLDGFSLHAKVALEAHDHDGRERLCRYLARPAIASERLSLAENGRVVYRLRRHWKDGTRAVVFAPLDFIARLAALVPRPLLARVTELRPSPLAPSAPERALQVRGGLSYPGRNPCGTPAGFLATVDPTTTYLELRYHERR